jgi:hypothetical protein
MERALENDRRALAHLEVAHHFRRRLADPEPGRHAGDVEPRRPPGLARSRRVRRPEAFVLVPGETGWCG